MIKLINNFNKMYLNLFFIEEMIVMPGESGSNTDHRVDVTFADHPLNSNPDSQWQTFFKDNEVLLQIDKDVRLVK